MHPDRREAVIKKTLIVLVTVIHLLPHPFGMSTLGATALYAGAYGHSRTSWLIPLIPLSIGIAIAGLYSPVVMICVFAGYVAAAIFARVLLGKKQNATRFAGALCAGAIIFFLLSNFGVWFAGFYSQSFSGLVACYIAGLPFLGIALMADAIYSGILFGLHELLGQAEANVDAA